MMRVVRGKETDRVTKDMIGKGNYGNERKVKGSYNR